MTLTEKEQSLIELVKNFKESTVQKTFAVAFLTPGTENIIQDGEEFEIATVSAQYLGFEKVKGSEGRSILVNTPLKGVQFESKNEAREMLTKLSIINPSFAPGTIAKIVTVSIRNSVK